ncbi:hypothetical protein ACFY1L_05385 [Streptomyces sp. NPDC001663]|uniref:hypothetical protein n=1 Tax=Streptomyces sp. NPDC001663 TaxID=3364597 RepID=UPI0036CD8C94
MSDQHTATALTAAAVTTMILFARAAVLHQGGRRHPARTGRPPRRRPTSGSDQPAPSAAGPSDAAACAVREAEHHVHRCWQHLDAHIDPPE